MALAFMQPVGVHYGGHYLDFCLGSLELQMEAQGFLPDVLCLSSAPCQQMLPEQPVLKKMPLVLAPLVWLETISGKQSLNKSVHSV